MVTIGQKAPDFTLVDSFGDRVSLSDFLGKKQVVLYFYPKDDTSGCTLEAQGFSQAKADYDALDTVILGVSSDTEKSHQKFCKKYGLTITLLADPEHKVIEAYGLWQLKKMMGNEYMGTVRTTFFIDKDGVVRHKWEKVTPAGHEQAVLKVIKEMQ